MNVDKNEVKRYLNMKNAEDAGIDAIIDEASALALKTLTPKSIINKFEVAFCDEGLKLKGTDIVFSGKLVQKTFADCSEIYIFAATLTLESELLLKRCFAKSSLYGIVCDSVLTTMIESYCDEIDEAINVKAERAGKHATRRISCGYGDFPLDCQRSILDIMNAEKILGVKLNENNMMYPNKTVTAVIGLSGVENSSLKGCETCKSQGCGFKR